MATATIAANSHTVVTGGWTNPSNAYSTTGDNVYATIATAKNTTNNGDFGFPDIASGTIPDGARIDAVRVVIEAGLSASVTGGLVGVQLRRNGTALGTEATKTTTTEATVTQTIQLPAITMADLRTASTLIKARVRATKGNSSTAMTVNLDFVRLEVDYTTQTGYPAEVFKLSPALYYRLGETASPFLDQATGLTNALSGSGSTLDVTGCLNVSGQDDGALQLDNSGFIDVNGANAAFFPSGAAVRTIVGWFRTSSVGVVPILTYGTLSTNSWVAASVDAGVIKLSNNTSIVSFGSGYNDGLDHMVVLSYSGTQWTCYVDGAQVGSATAQTMATVLTSQNAWIGTNGSDFATGVLDEVALLTVAVSSTDVTNLFNAGRVSSTPKTANDSGTGADSTSARAITAVNDTWSLTLESATADQGSTPKTASETPLGADSTSARSIAAADAGTGADGSSLNTGGYPAAVLAKSPKMYLRLGETSGNYVDSASGGSSYALSGSGSTRGVIGALTASGQDDGALQLANSGFIDFTASPNASSFPTGVRTLVAWFRTTSSGEVPFITYGQAAAGAWCSFRLNAGAVQIDKYGTSITFGSGYNDGQNHMAAAVYDGTAWTCYIDGAQVGSAQTLTMPTSLTSQNAWVGTTGSSFATGIIDEPAIFPSALTGTDISNLYSNGAVLAPTSKNATDSGTFADIQSTVDTLFVDAGAAADVVTNRSIVLPETGAGADTVSARAIVTSGDQGTGSDASSLTYTATDTGTGSDAVSVSGKAVSDSAVATDDDSARVIVASDTAVGADTWFDTDIVTSDTGTSADDDSARAIVATDAGSLTGEVSTLNTGSSFNANDAGAGADSINTLGMASVESGTGADSSSRGITSTDAGTGADGFNTLGIGASDAGTAGDPVSAMGLQTTDSGSLAGESSNLNTGSSFTANDSGAATDAISARDIAGAEAGATTETAGAGYSATDAAAGIDTASSQTAAISATEVGAGADSSNRDIAASDSGTGADASSPTYAVTAQDAGTAGELVAMVDRALNDSGAFGDSSTPGAATSAVETGTGQENPSLVVGSHSRTETGAGLDSSAISVVFYSTETPTVTDSSVPSGFRAVVVFDTGHGSDGFGITFAPGDYLLEVPGTTAERPDYLLEVD